MQRQSSHKPKTPKGPAKSSAKLGHGQHGEKSAHPRHTIQSTDGGAVGRVKSTASVTRVNSGSSVMQELSMTRRATTASMVSRGGPEGPLDKVKRVFELCDADHSGTISRRELGLLLQRLGNFTASDINRIMQEVDKDESGEIDYDEFLTWISSPGSAVGVMDDGEAVKFDLETAFKPLWRVFDRNDGGSISHEEFHECYLILTGAMRALPQPDGAPPVAALVTSDEDRIFKIIDKDHNNEISFVEFVEWQREAIQHSGISQKHLVELVQQLSCLLEDVFMLSRSKRMKDSNTLVQDPIMKAILPKVATCSRELWRRTTGKTVSGMNLGEQLKEELPVEWPDLPSGLDTHKLIRRHLQDPVPTLDVQTIHVRIHSLVPDLSSDGHAGGTPRWLAKVLRTILYKDSHREVVQYYYAYKASVWSGLQEREQFYKALMILPTELRLYSLLMAEADFGTVLKWPQIQLVMEDAKKMGFLSTEELLEFNLSIEKAMMRELDKRRLDPDALRDLEKKKEALQNLLPEAQFSPIEVMQTLTAYGITALHPLWAPDES